MAQISMNVAYPVKHTPRVRGKFARQWRIGIMHLYMMGVWAPVWVRIRPRG